MLLFCLLLALLATSICMAGLATIVVGHLTDDAPTRRAGWTTFHFAQSLMLVACGLALAQT